MKPTLLTIGADPGASGGLALCRCVSGQKPELLGAWLIEGSGDGGYFQAALKAAFQLQATAGKRVDIVWVEEPRPFGKPGAAIGLARRQGLILGALSMIAAPEATHIQPSEWWAVWGDNVRRGKDDADDGAHRRTEAMSLLTGRLGDLQRLPVDVSEAALIAGAAGLHRLGEGFTRTPAPRKPRTKKVKP